jgi:YHS domain-containing protein
MKIVLISLFCALTALQVKAQDANAVRKKHFNLENGIVLDGYDPVAYFKQGKAVKGKKDFAVFHQGVTYHFSSALNKEEFKKNPAGYEPQYGGWCAYAMGDNGEKVSIDPETFKIVNGKLFLFYNKFFNNTLKSWNKDENNLKRKADQNWNKLFH